MKINTACVHGAENNSSTTGAVTVPIYQTSTFSHPALGGTYGYDYSRTQNPTREYLEKTIANLENGVGALAFSTGMAAETALMELFEPGDSIIVSDDLYGGTERLFNTVSIKNGVKIIYADTSSTDEIKNAIDGTTKAIFAETPTNPMMKVTDISETAKIAHAHNALLIIDNTFLTPYFQKPLLLNADIVIHSGTKYLGGHNDTLCGFLVCKDMQICEKLRYIYKTTGACLSPFDSYLIIRGIKTLAVRMKKHEENALAVAEWLAKCPKIKKVYYPGLENHPQIEISRKQSAGFGGMISFETDTKQTAVQILENVKLVAFAESLGGVETLITYPLTQTHAELSEERRIKNGINDKLLRLSVGIEDAQDIIDDLSLAIG